MGKQAQNKIIYLLSNLILVYSKLAHVELEPSINKVEWKFHVKKC